MYQNSIPQNNLVEEPQLAIKYNTKLPLKVIKGIKDLKLLSLFSGCGGMDLGFEGGFQTLSSSVNEELTPDFIEKRVNTKFVQLKLTRFKTVFANDILQDARNAWVNYFSKRGYNPDTYFTESIVDLVKMHKSGHRIFPEKVDIITGGFPCQDFSIAGKRKGFNSHKNHRGEIIKENKATVETRGQLYMWMKEVIEITKPKIFIAENVKGLVNLSNVKDIIQSDFSATGGNDYIVLPPKVLHAADYGVAQSRERVFFIGIRKSALNNKALKALSLEVIPDEYSPYPPATHAYTQNTTKLKPYVKLKEVLSDISEPEASVDLSQQHYSKAKFMGKHCQGQTEMNLEKISPTIRAEHHGNIEFRRLSKENGGIINNELNKGLKQRRLTPRECGLIQTFPNDFEFVIKKQYGRKGTFLVSASKAYKIIGNAVPPLLAFNLAKRIEKNWNLYF